MTAVVPICGVVVLRQGPNVKWRFAVSLIIVEPTMTYISLKALLLSKRLTEDLEIIIVSSFQRLFTLACQ